MGDSVQMASSEVRDANTSPLKRSFDHTTFALDYLPYYEHSRVRRQDAERRSLSVSSTFSHEQPYRHTKRRTLSSPSASSMLAQSPSIMSASFPSFMSVYGSEDTNVYDHTLPEHGTKPEQFAFSHLQTNSNQSPLISQPRLIERRSSLNSSTSYSTDSSPTTTDSTFDSPLMADQSPDSSPESATATMPPKSFQQSFRRSAGPQMIDFPSERRTVVPLRPAPVTEQVAEEPKRNMKNLKIDMKLPNMMQAGTISDASLAFPSLASPLREPPKTGRRKPNNLSIRTPGFNQLSFGANALAIPPTPGHKPISYQAQLSPALPVLASPTTGPVGGMRLAMPNVAQHFKRDSLPGSTTSDEKPNLPVLREEPYQPPKSQETPEKGYTDGPCLIYDSGVYLYLEPTAEEAAKFDTVINVAREINSPFDLVSHEKNTVMSVWRNADKRQSIPEPQTAVSEISFKSAFEWPSEGDSASPTTPKATSRPQTKRPEYLHVKWDHNSEILEDLYPLCRLIDDRVNEKKKVLIHCQLGVSRSASLIIAYGLYKNYESDFHSMYMAVKKRSQWVGPNMSLIYQLTDFKGKFDRGVYTESKRLPKPEWFIYSAENVTAPTSTTQSPQAITQNTSFDQRRNSRPILRLNKELPPVPLFSKEERVSTDSSSSVDSSGPKTITSINATFKKPAKRAVPRALPFREMGYSNHDMTIPPHRPRVVPGLTFAQPSMDLAMQDVPTAPSLFSPRAAEFMAAPFGVTTAGDLVTTTPKTVKPPPGAFPGGNEWRNSLFFGQDVHTASAVPVTMKPLPSDPRSPPQFNETREILRSIDDIL